MLLLIVFAVGGLVCCWIWADTSPRTNLVLTVVYAASWGLQLLPFPYQYAFPLAQCGFAIAFGWLAFGVDWLMRDAYHWRGPR